MISEWLGIIGESIDIDVIVRSYIHRDKWKSNSTLYLLEDKRGNYLTFRSTSRFEVGRKWRFSGVVKSHTSFRGQHQTHVCNWGFMLPARELK